jgi:hypothetical protein
LLKPLLNRANRFDAMRSVRFDRSTYPPSVMSLMGQFLPRHLTERAAALPESCRDRRIGGIGIGGMGIIVGSFNAAPHRLDSCMKPASGVDRGSALSTSNSLSHESHNKPEASLIHTGIRNPRLPSGGCWNVQIVYVNLESVRLWPPHQIERRRGVQVVTGTCGLTVAQPRKSPRRKPARAYLVCDRYAGKMATISNVFGSMIKS